MTSAPSPLPLPRGPHQRVCIQAIRELHRLGALDDYLKPVFGIRPLSLWRKDGRQGSAEGMDEPSSEGGSFGRALNLVTSCYDS